MSLPKVTRRINVSLKQLMDADLIKPGQVLLSVDLKATVLYDGDISYVKNGKSTTTKSLKQFAAAGRGWTWCPSREIILPDYTLYEERKPEDIQLRDLFEVYAEKMGIQILPRKDAKKQVEERKVPTCLIPPPGHQLVPTRPKAKPAPPPKPRAKRSKGKTPKKPAPPPSATVVCKEVGAGALAKTTSIPSQPSKEPLVSLSSVASNLQQTPPAKAPRGPPRPRRSKANDETDDESSEDEDEEEEEAEEEEEEEKEEREPESEPVPADPKAALRVAKQEELPIEKPAQVVTFIPKRVKSSLRLKVESVYPGLASLEMHLGEEELERLWVQWESESRSHAPKASNKREAPRQNHTKGPGRKKPRRGSDPEDEPPRKRIMVEEGKGKNGDFSPKSGSDWGLEEDSQQDEKSDSSSPRLTPVKGLETNDSPPDSPTSPFSDPSSDSAGNCSSDYGFSPISPPQDPEPVEPYFPMPEGFAPVLDLPLPSDLWATALSYGGGSILHSPLGERDPGMATSDH